jgi:GTPase
MGDSLSISDESLSPSKTASEDVNLEGVNPEGANPEGARDDFASITDDLRYEQAIAAVVKLIKKLNLSERERSGLKTDINHLHGLLKKLESQVVHIAVFGMVGRGKSSLLNALVGQPIFQTGPLHGVTRQAESIPWDTSSAALYLKSAHSEAAHSGAAHSEAALTSRKDAHKAVLPGQQASRVELIDTPGIDEVGGEERQAIAQTIAHQADLILFIIAGDLTQLEYTALAELSQAGKPILLVLNKIDQYSLGDREQILTTLRQKRLAHLLPPENILTAAAAPLITQAVRSADGKLTTQTRRAAPDVSSLKLKILEILQREGKALIALNTLLYADDINEQVVAQKLNLRNQAADDTIWKTTLTKAIAVALNPVTVVDLLGGAAIDIALIVTLARLYGLELTQRGATKLLKEIALAMGGLTASELVVSFGLSGLKSALAAAAIPTGGLTATPYVSVALAQAAVSGVSTYAIAQVAKTYLANGATWGTDSPKAVVAKILSDLDEDSIMRQIRTELAAKLDLKSHWQQ